MKVNTLSLKTNKFFDDGAYIGNTDMRTIVKNNVLNDYQRTGIKSGNITIIPANIYSGNNLVVSWRMGQLIKLGSVVRIADNNGNSAVYNNNNEETLFRVVSREVNYKGEPTIALGLMQVK